MAEKRETSPPDPLAQQPASQADLLAIVRELVAANTLTVDKIREIATAATVDAYEKLEGKFWDVRKYPAISDFNPQGEKEHPRPEILGEVFWVGYKLQKEEMTPEEITLVNQIEPGVYHDGQWIVKDLQPGVRNRKHRKLLVLFPCKDNDARASLPQAGMVAMLREMVDAQKAALVET